MCVLSWFYDGARHWKTILLWKIESLLFYLNFILVCVFVCLFSTVLFDLILYVPSAISQL